MSNPQFIPSVLHVRKMLFSCAHVLSDQSCDVGLTLSYPAAATISRVQPEAAKNAMTEEIDPQIAQIFADSGKELLAFIRGPIFPARHKNTIAKERQGTRRRENGNERSTRGFPDPCP